MRKHRLYGVAIAVLLGTSLIDHRPGIPHHAAAPDISRAGIRLASAALLPDATHLTASAPAATNSRSTPVGLLRPARTSFVERLWTWAAYVDAHRPPPPAPTPPRPPTATRAPAVAPRAAPVPAPATTDVWAGLRQCESGGNYADNTGNGYYGAYQFSLTTWHGLGFGGLPSQAPADVQDQAAQRLQARSGWSQWPNCSRRLHLT